jgi:hypothetical protein
MSIDEAPPQIQAIVNACSDCQIAYQRTGAQQETWFLDITHPSLHIEMEWSEKHGYGLSVNEDHSIFGKGYAEIFQPDEEDKVLQRLQAILKEVL